MPITEINAKAGKDADSPSAKANFDIPDTVAACVTKYGEGVVYSRFTGALVIDAQAKMRAALKLEKTPKQIQEELDNWTPGVKTKGKSDREKAEDSLSKLSDEEKAELFKMFSAKGGKK